MNNLENSGERLLRDKLLQHEFAADEQAWGKMNELLANHLPPAPPISMVSSTSGKVVWFTGRHWLMALVAFGLIGWWLLAPAYPEGAETGLLEKTADKAEISSPYLENKPAPIAAGENNHLSKAGKNAVLAPSPSAKSTNNQLTPKEISTHKNKSIYGNNSRLNKNDPAVRNFKKTARQLKQDTPGQLDNSLEKSTKNLVPPIIISPITDPATHQLVPNADSLANIQAVHLNKASNSLFNVLPLRDMPLSGQPAKPRGTVPPWTNHHRERRVQVGIVGGGQLAYVPQNAYKKIGGSFTGGFSMNYQLTSLWSIQADLLYRRVPYHLSARFEQNRLDAGGNYERLSYAVRSNDVLFFELPLLVKRAFFNEHINLLGGLRPAFIHPMHTDGGGVASGVYTSSFPPSLRDGVRRFDLALTVGGELRIWRNLWIHARISQGLLDLTNDDFFQNTNADVTSDMHLSLRYYFFSFN